MQAEKRMVVVMHMVGSLWGWGWVLKWGFGGWGCGFGEGGWLGCKWAIAVFFSIFGWTEGGSCDGWGGEVRRVGWDGVWGFCRIRMADGGVGGG